MRAYNTDLIGSSAPYVGRQGRIRLFPAAEGRIMVSGNTHRMEARMTHGCHPIANGENSLDTSPSVMSSATMVLSV